MVKILNGDALQLIDTLEADSFDLIILDPDYQDWSNIIKSGFIEKCLTLLKSDGNMLLFTKQPFDYELRVHINNIFRREIVWTFTNGGAWVSDKMPLVSFQKIYWCVKSNNFYFNPRTHVDYSENTKNFKRKSKVWDGYNNEGREFEKSAEGVWLRDHLHYNKPMTGAIPSKPEELLQILIRCFCKPNGTILNPFAGSGFVEMTAREEGHDTVSFEIDETRCEDIKNLIRSSQYKLW